MPVRVGLIRTRDFPDGSSVYAPRIDNGTTGAWALKRHIFSELVQVTVWNSDQFLIFYKTISTWVTTARTAAIRSRRWLIERSENDRFDMAYPTGLEKCELTTIQLTRVMYAVREKLGAEI